ncbi:hypothetical protein Pint_31130 [Pistacia integerrima]|uniref:Uncharacterized protein n=1 Tax=Pistacia integerrima TaxID=434235 RepID=A0ACC0XQS0_9ROSI|nr:hypothetical protein Pint_31130 [Pistacia integerrima]
MPHENHDVRFTSSSLKVPLFRPHSSLPFFSQTLIKTRNSLSQLLDSLKIRSTESTRSVSSSQKLHSAAALLLGKNKERLPLLCSASLSLAQSESAANSPLLCSASLSLSQLAPEPPPPPSSQTESPTQQVKGQGQAHSLSRYDEERVLISEVLVRNKDGEELERKDLEAEALTALRACRANSALTIREVQEDVHRIIDSGYFCSCMPVAVDTRDGIRLVFQVEPNQEFHGLVCEGANVLPSKFLEDSFRDGYGKIVNVRRLEEVISSINGWYTERGLFGLVSGVEILSGGVIRLQVVEAEVNNISIRFLDRKTGEPTKGKTKPETILRQLTTKKGQLKRVTGVIFLDYYEAFWLEF